MDFGPPLDPMFDVERRRLNVDQYTWSHPLAIDADDFSTLKAICFNIHENQFDELVGGGLGLKEGGPVFSKEEICFNGIKPLDGDSFYFPRISEDLFDVVPPQPGYHYERACTTYNHPYSILVAACLAAALDLEIIPKFESTNKGDNYKIGLGLYKQIKKEKKWQT